MGGVGNYNMLSNAVIIKIIVSILLITIGAFSVTHMLDVKGSDYNDKVFLRALTTFALVKTLNGIISVIQGTKIQAQPAGVGISFAAGEILDPMNDLIERFSWVMLASVTSLGIQKILFNISNWSVIKVILFISIIIILICIWSSKYNSRLFISIGYKLLLIAIVIRFSMSIVSIINDQIHYYFIKDTYMESTQTLKQTRNDLESIVEKSAEQYSEDISLWEKTKKSAAEVLNVKKQFSVIKEKLTNVTRKISDLIAIFVLETIILPLLVLWALIKFAGYISRYNIFSFIEQQL